MLKENEVVLVYANQIKRLLGANYREETDEVLREIVEEITSIACDVSHREWSDKKLFPYISKAVRAEYLTRGAEGLLSSGERKYFSFV